MIRNLRIISRFHKIKFFMTLFLFAINRQCDDTLNNYDISNTNITIYINSSFRGGGYRYRLDGQVCIKFGGVQAVYNNVVKQRGILCILSIFSRQKKDTFFFVFFVFKKFFFAIVKSKICHIYHEDKHGFNIFFGSDQNKSDQNGSKWIKLETFRSFLCDSQIQIRHILT